MRIRGMCLDGPYRFDRGREYYRDTGGTYPPPTSVTSTTAAARALQSKARASALTPGQRCVKMTRVQGFDLRPTRRTSYLCSPQTSVVTHTYTLSAGVAHPHLGGTPNPPSVSAVLRRKSARCGTPLAFASGRASATVVALLLGSIDDSIRRR